MTTTNVDIIPVSSLPSIERTTVSDTFIVNDNDEAGNVTTKVISAPNLAADIGARININELAGVSLDSPEIGNVIKWNGTAWVPAQDLTGEGGAGIALTDLNAVTAPTGVGAGSLTYNNLQGIFTYTPPLLTLENMDNVSDQVPVTGQFLRWGGSFWYPSSTDNSFSVVNLDVGVGLGSLDLTDTTFTYTPPDLSNFLTAEADPVFSASAAASITYEDVANWNQLLIDLGEEDTLNDLADVSTNGFTPSDGMVLTYDAATGIWYPKAVPYGALGDLTDVYADGAEANDILVYNGNQWRAQPNPATNITAGIGLSGGGFGENITINANIGFGLEVLDNFIRLDANLEQLKNVSAQSARNGHVLTYQEGFWVPLAPGLVGAQNLGDLNDVNTSNQGQNKVLTYYNNLWVARDLPSNNTPSLNDLTDVNTSGVSNGQVIKYQNGLWIASDDLTATSADGAAEVYVGNDNSSAGGSYLIFTNNSNAGVKPIYEDNKLKYYPADNILQTIGGGFSAYASDPGEGNPSSGSINGVEIISSGVIEIIDNGGNAHIDFKNNTQGHDWRLTQDDDDFQITYSSASNQITEYLDLNHNTQTVTIGENCTNKKADLRVNGDLSVCGSITSDENPNYPLIGVKIWGHIRRPDTSPANESSEGWYKAGGTNNFTVEEYPQWGMVKIVFDYPIGTEDYSTMVCGRDQGADHMYGVYLQKSNYVVLYSKDVARGTESGGGSLGDRYEGDAPRWSFMFQIVF